MALYRKVLVQPAWHLLSLEKILSMLGTWLSSENIQSLKEYVNVPKWLR